MTKSALELITEYQKIIDLNENRVNIKSQEYDTRDQAEDEMYKYYTNYHPAGYGTKLSLEETPEGKFFYTGYRWDSAD